MASLEGQQENYSNNPAVENIPKRPESREGSIERKASKDREDKLRYARDRQNEERQRKIEELRAQAEAAQKYREQKEEERRRRIEEIRVRDTEKRHQVEERKKAIIEAEKERREYILKKNLERDSRIETKKRDRNSIAFAFGSSTPRLLDVPADYGLVSPSTFWSQRRSTSISNVAGASLSRRSSERELADSGAKKRASSSTDRHDDHRRKSSSMYEVFNWGHSNDEPPKRFSLSIAGSEINIDGPAPTRNHAQKLTSTPPTTTTAHRQNTIATESHNNYNNNSYRKEDNVDTTQNMMFRSVYRRKTDLMPTIPSPRDGHYGSRSSLSTTPRTPGSRSGNVTPGGHLSGSRPGSAMSTSTTLSTTGLVPRRPATAPRKPRPASIAGTGMSLDEINKLKRENKPPVKTSGAASPSTSTAQTTPKRTPNLMSTSMIVTSSSSRFNSAEKKTPTKRETLPPKAASASKAQPNRTGSMERINRRTKESTVKGPSVMSTSMIVTTSSASSTTTVTAAPAASVAPVVPPASAVEANGVAKEQEELPADVPVTEIASVPDVSKAEKEALNTVRTEQMQQLQQEQEQQQPVAVQIKIQTQPEPASDVKEVLKADPMETSVNVEEKADEGNEKTQEQETAVVVGGQKKTLRNGSKENSEVRELTPPTANVVDGNNDLMTASMIARKITTEEEAKAALAERRRLAREEAERQAELERQRLEAERLAELKAQEEEAERQRLFEEEATRLAEEQRRGEEERLRKAIEEAQQREEEEQRRREDEERQRIEREEAEKKAKEEAEKQRVEVAERLKREEKEREERRKRVEAIMSRTRKGGAAAGAAAATTPAKESTDAKAASAPKENDTNHGSGSGSISSSSNSADGSPSSSSTDTPAPTKVSAVAEVEAPNSQAMYEQSVLDKENSLINSFSNLIIDENAKNLHQFEVSNGKLQLHMESAPTAAVANGNGHIENVNNKNDINLLQDAVTPAVTQLIDLSIESQDLHINNNNNNNNNNNSLLTSTAATNNTLVTADSHENKDISLL